MESRTALALPATSARHPFRKDLPSHITQPLVLADAHEDERDWKLFVLSFAAFFTVFYSFIA